MKGDKFKMDENINGVDIVKAAETANLRIKEALKKSETGILSGKAVSAIYGLVQANAVTDDDTVKTFASTISNCQNVFSGVEWHVGMQTKPGDIIHYDNYNFIYSGKESMTHSNPLFYPGAKGVYYWQVIPETKDDWKVWPDIPDAVCAVLMGESWWNVEKTKLYTWNGADTTSCVWAPSDSINEWIYKDIVEVQ